MSHLLGRAEFGGAMGAADVAYADGENFEILILKQLATVRVWQRPDLSFQQGAALAQRIKGHIRALAEDETVRAILIDQREAPPLIGKNTRAAISEMITLCSANGKRVALLSGSSVQHAIMCSIVQADELGHAFTDLEAARRWLQLE